MPTSFKVHFFRRRPVEDWLFLMVLAIFVCLSVYTYFHFVQDWIEGNSTLRIGADSDRYWDAGRAMGTQQSESLLTLTGNFLGPALLARIFRTGVGVLCFNLALLLLSFKVAASIPKVRLWVFGFLVLLNAEILPSVTTLNKEILVLFSAVLAAKYVSSQKHSILLLLVTLLISLAARWEQAMILLLFVIIRHTPYRARPVFVLLAGLLVITVAYPVAFKFLGVDTSLFDSILAGGGLILRLNELQAHYLFPVVLLPKIFMNMAGRVAAPTYYLSGAYLQDLNDPQQVVFQPLGCAAYLLVFGFALLRRRLSLDRPLVFLSAITLLTTAVTPFIQPRYLFGPYVWICLELAATGPNTESSLIRGLRRLCRGRRASALHAATEPNVGKRSYARGEGLTGC